MAFLDLAILARSLLMLLPNWGNKLSRAPRSPSLSHHTALYLRSALLFLCFLPLPVPDTLLAFQLSPHLQGELHGVTLDSRNKSFPLLRCGRTQDWNNLYCCHWPQTGRDGWLPEKARLHFRAHSSIRASIILGPHYCPQRLRASFRGQMKIWCSQYVNYPNLASPPSCHSPLDSVRVGYTQTPLNLHSLSARALPHEPRVQSWVWVAGAWHDISCLPRSQKKESAKVITLNLTFHLLSLPGFLHAAPPSSLLACKEYQLKFAWTTLD